MNYLQYGMSRIANYNQKSPSKICKEPNRSDYEAIRKDWINVGRNIKDAVNQHRKQSCL